MPEATRAPWWHPLAVVLVAAALALPMLGWAGLSQSEGHRAIPGWAMLRSGDPLHVTLFERTYLRKPPGMPWAIAASSALVGQTELGARLPSALGFVVMSGLAWWFGARWFGARWGLAAGLAQALMPAMWPWARSAEIECLHALATQAACLLVIDICTRAPSRVVGALLPAIWLSVSLCAMALLKGPAGAAALGGALLGACLATGSIRSLARPALWTGVALAAAILIPLGRAILLANSDPGAVRQGPGEFLWSADRLAGIALLVPAALLAGLPATLALLLAWGPRSDAPDAPGDRSAKVARALALATLAGLGISAAAGISNVRYALPALTLAPTLAGFVLRGLAAPGGFTGPRRTLARLCTLGDPRILAGAMLVTAGIWIPLQDRSRARNSGREAGLTLAAHVPPGSTILADDAIDTRPEVAHALATGAPGARVVWSPDLADGRISAPGASGPVLVLLRTDARAPEPARFAQAIARGELQLLGTARAHHFEFTLFRVATRP